ISDYLQVCGPVAEGCFFLVRPSAASSFHSPNLRRREDLSEGSRARPPEASRECAGPGTNNDGSRNRRSHIAWRVPPAAPAHPAAWHHKSLKLLASAADNGPQSGEQLS